jgi:hypothetical protein
MTLDTFLSTVAAQRKQITVYTTGREELPLEQFETRNVTIEERTLPEDGPPGFVVIHDEDGFSATLGLAEFRTLLTPPIHRPWDDEVETSYRPLFEILDNTLFASFDRRRMLAVSREVEERAWRIGNGTLRCGFQSARALRAQESVYQRLAEETDLDIHIYLSEHWDRPTLDNVTFHVESDEEIGDTWFVVHDGGTHTLSACGLIAEEIADGRFRGFWTYDDTLVGEILTYLETAYG